MSALLDVSDLRVEYPTRFGIFTAIDGVNLTLQPGEIHGLVGESGAGKSTLGAAIIGLLQPPGYIANGDVKLNGKSLRALNNAQYHKVRGAEISMIFQDPQTALNPLLTIEDQMVETIRQHADVDYPQARQQAIDLLIETGLENIESRMQEYPHQFSGGMRQRVVIALALCTNPEVIIADEPTTALDVAIQKQVLHMIKQLAQNRGVGIILITHDIGVIAEITDNVSVLRHGKLMESGPTRQVLGNPQNEYTKALMAAVPTLGKKLERFTNIVRDDDDADDDWHVPGASAEFASEWLLSSAVESGAAQDDILSVRDLDMVFYPNRPFGFGKREGFQALNDISLEVKRGEVLGIIGESGSGKSTLAKSIVGLVTPTTGTISFEGRTLPLGRARSRDDEARRKIQMIFQDPYSSLNSRRRVADIVGDPIRFFGLAKDAGEVQKIVASVLELVEMPQQAMLRYPHQFSGGQRQRIAVARALVSHPTFLICDEPTSALDVSIQAQILNLLKDLQQKLGLSILFISHNLAVIRQMSDRVVVLKNGVIVEDAEAETFFAHPKANYSQQLLADTPSLNFVARTVD